MNDIIEIINKIKEETGGIGSTDRDVAMALGMKSANHLALHKRRGSIPYLLILEWCRRTKTPMERIFYKDGK